MTVFDLSKTEQFTLFEQLKADFVDPEKSFDFPSLEQKYGIELDPDIKAFLEGCKEQNTYINPEGPFPLSIDCDKSALSIAAYIGFENYNAHATARMDYSVDNSKQYEYHNRSGDLVTTNSLNECMDSYKEKCNTYSLYNNLISVANESVKINPEIQEFVEYCYNNDFKVQAFHEPDSDTITATAEKDGQILGMTTDGKDCYFDYRDDFSSTHTRSFDHIQDFINYRKNEPTLEPKVREAEPEVSIAKEEHKPKHHKNRDIDFGR